MAGPAAALLYSSLARAAAAARSSSVGTWLLGARSAAIGRTVLTGVETVTLVDFAADMYVGEDVFIDSDLAFKLGLGALGVRGVTTLVKHQDKLKSGMIAAKESLKTATSPGARADALAALRAATARASHSVRHPAQMLGALVISNLPRFVRFGSKTAAAMGKGAVFEIIRRAKTSSYTIIGKSGAILGRLSPSGLELSATARKSAAFVAVSSGTAAGLALLESNEPAVVEAVSQYLSVSFAELVPDEARFTSRGYSEVLDEHIAIAMRDPQYYASRVSSSMGVSAYAAYDIVASEIADGLLRCQQGSVVVAHDDAELEEEDFFDVIAEFFGFDGDAELSVDDEAKSRFQESKKSTPTRGGNSGGSGDVLNLRQDD